MSFIKKFYFSYYNLLLFNYFQIFFGRDDDEKSEENEGFRSDAGIINITNILDKNVFLEDL